MATYIDGIGASENIDTSGEIVSIAGMDISSLEVDGYFNFEHESKTPASVIGKILKAKKIFTDADCEDDRQLYFWQKCKTPFLYVMGELFDDYKDSAREVAGMFRYDADHNNERNIMNFSIEGSKISKENITVTRSIARKVTLTPLPCNKQAVAEMVAAPTAKSKKSAIDELFKTESIEIEVFKPDTNFLNLLKKEDPNKHAAKLGIKPFQKDMAGGSIANTASSALSGSAPTSAGGLLASENMKKAAPKIGAPAAAPKPHERGQQIGTTSGGHGVFSHGMVGDYTHFSHKDHAEASAAHQRASGASKDPKIKQHHADKARLHAARGVHLESEGRERAERAQKLKTTPPRKSSPNLGTNQKLHDPDLSGTHKPLTFKKAMDAGSALAGPGNLVQGAALSKEKVNKSLENVTKSAATETQQESQMVKSAAELRKDFSNPKLSEKEVKVKKLQSDIDSGKYKTDATKISGAMLDHPEKPLKGTKVQKSEMLQRAEAEYASWSKREQFETWMQKRMPSLTKSQIKVIGSVMVLQKSIKQEKMLKDFYNPGMLKNQKNKK